MAGVGLTRFFMGLYNYNSVTDEVTYANSADYLRAIEINPEIRQAEGEKLYANNVVKEDQGGEFGGGTLRLTTDELPQEVSRFISGILLETELIGNIEVPVLRFGKNVKPPHIGFATIRTGQYTNDNGITKQYYRPYLYRKIKFDIPIESCKTRGGQIEWQVRELVADISRDDTMKEEWHWEAYCESEELAVAVCKKWLNVTATSGDPDDPDDDGSVG